MRSHLLSCAALAVGTLGACGDSVVGLGFCLNIDGNCPRSSGPIDHFWIEGFPADKVGPPHPTQYGAWGELIKGDSITLYLLFGAGSGGKRDTVRSVGWTVSDTAVARIAAGTGGSGTMVAIAPGAFYVNTNNEHYRMLACRMDRTCSDIGQVRVAAPPTPRLTR